MTATIVDAGPGVLVDPEHENNKMTAARVKLFLDDYAIFGVAAHACKVAAISRRTYWRWLKESEQFAQMADEAKEQSIGALELEARRRATEGVDEAIVSKGEILGYQKRYSDGLLLAMLKAKIPEYQDKVKVEVGVSDELMLRLEAARKRLMPAGAIEKVAQDVIEIGERATG